MANNTIIDKEVIKERLHSAWSAWQPDYEGWLKWSNDLYAPDAVITAIGAAPQNFRDYQASMKEQRDAFDMNMGVIDICIVEGNTAAITYQMAMKPKNGGASKVFIVSEFNEFEMPEGYDKPMVKSLVLCTGNSAEGTVKKSVLDCK